MDEVQAEVVSEEEGDPRPGGGLSRRDVVALQETRHRENLYEQTVVNMQAIVRAPEIDPEQPDPPDDWVAEFGEERARSLLKMAQLSYLPRRSVPYFVTAQADLYKGLEYARATDKLVKAPVAVQVNINHPLPPPPPVLEVRKDDDMGGDV